ncbi:substrate-binding and VWA domain-containing protein [Streptomyces benahoarensis]|uniref:VWA domain-containing protein n=1 Tax=Streptomyces benahoarensis TaxID=2595054 RepID=A0A553ZNP3_9ACTN|nr:substrate-binding and VWA domain-containing protein [Streptomyces benahoarensis]TSB26134.1 VWA domain-containing protein [Streptomyces benahoarensis]TSB43080.1 VWA domain-containing protein [Streptomyces benahoarensis]
MGRHSLPDSSEPDGAGPRPGTRRRTVVLATALVLALAAGTVVVLRADLLPFGKPCGGDSVRLDVVASPDIAPALDDVADQALRDETRTDGKCLDVKVTARSGAEVADSLAQRPAHNEFQVWIPDSTLWEDRVEAASGTPLTTSGTIAASPLALGAVPAAAEKLGWPEKTYGWAAMAKAADDGTLPLGVADPARSATGLLALSRIDAAYRKEKTGEDADTAQGRTAAAAKVLHRWLADGDEELAATLPRDASDAETADPHRNQTVLLSEQAAFAHNRAATGPGLELFYPADGTAQLDYPYTLVDENQLDADQSRAASRFMTLLATPEGQQVLRTHGFRAGHGRADEKVTRAAGGRAPQPYTQDAAPLPSAKEIRALLGMWTVTVQNARLTTVVDASSSMGLAVPGSGGRSRMTLARDSLLRALTTFTPDDEIGLWKFATVLDGSRDYLEVSPTTRLGGRDSGGSTHRDGLAAALRMLAPVPGGGTGLYDTTLAAYREARSSYAEGKFNAVVVVTDGADDDADSIGLDGLVEQVKKLTDPGQPIPLIALALGPEADRSALDRMVAPTGGSAHEVEDPSQIDKVIRQAIVAAGSEEQG